MNGMGGPGIINITSKSGQNENKEKKSIRTPWPLRETPEQAKADFPDRPEHQTPELSSLATTA